MLWKKADNIYWKLECIGSDIVGARKSSEFSRHLPGPSSSTKLSLVFDQDRGGKTGRVTLPRHSSGQDRQFVVVG